MTLDTDTLNKAAEAYGTPLYLYDLDLLKDKVDQFKGYVTWPKLKLYYAMKANYNFHVLKVFKEQGICIDAVSPGDLYMARKVGFPVSRIMYTANNMTDQEVDEVMETGVLMNIDSLTRLEKFGKKYPGSNVCLRFNPDVVDGEHEKIMTGGDLTKFGILLKDALRATAIANAYNLKVVGLHEHTGSGLQRTDSVIKSMENVMAIATRDNFPNLEFLDFGGGFKVSYHPDDVPVDYVQMGQEITSLFTRFCVKYGKELTLCFEPGKYLVAEAGHFLVHVNTVKNNNGRVICGTNSGFPQLIRPMFYDAYHHIKNLTNPKGDDIACDICGNICETGDLFAQARYIPKVSEGDLLLIETAGAYCYSMGSYYNMRSMPAEAIYTRGKLSLSRKRLSSRELVENILNETCD